MSEEVPEFVSQGWYRYRGKGWVALVECDRQRDRMNTGLSGAKVSIDGELFDCIAVERHMPATPISKGEKIGLLVREPA